MMFRSVRVIEEVNTDNIREKAKRFRALSNPLHLKMMILLDKEGAKTSSEVHAKLKGYVHRENSYQALEKLREAGVLKKAYDQKKKKFYYSISP